MDCNHTFPSDIAPNGIQFGQMENCHYNHTILCWVHNQMENCRYDHIPLCWVHNQMENCHYDHIFYVWFIIKWKTVATIIFLYVWFIIKWKTVTTIIFLYIGFIIKWKTVATIIFLSIWIESEFYFSKCSSFIQILIQFKAGFFFFFEGVPTEGSFQTSPSNKLPAYIITWQFRSSYL